jgi:hypothetical protein
VAEREDVLQIAEEHRIGIDGYLVDSSLPSSVARRSFEQSNEDWLEQISRVRAWVSKFVKRRTINRNADSQFFCIRIGRETGGPIRTGSFIIGCILQGVAVRQVAPTSAEAFTNLSFKLIVETLT